MIIGEVGIHLPFSSSIKVIVLILTTIFPTIGFIKANYFLPTATYNEVDSTVLSRFGCLKVNDIIGIERESHPIIGFDLFFFIFRQNGSLVELKLPSYSETCANLKLAANELNIEIKQRSYPDPTSGGEI